MSNEETSPPIEILWVNHASFVLKYRDVNMICDPWIEGRVFNESWSLLSKTRFEYSDFKDITHIFFSHEHPDHFFPPNIKKIPAEYKSRISVLFQTTIDQKVRDYCLKLGFKDILELQPWEEYNLTSGLRITNSKVSNDTDSWLLIKCGDKTLLNLNDCVFKKKEELEKINDKIDGLDVLFTQFSYANWAGNKGDLAEMKKRAQDKIDDIKLQLDVFKPKFTVPFASYVWFCHKDNFHLNEGANKISEIHHLLENSGTRSIVLYPGESWQVGEEHDSVQSVDKYEKDASLINDDNLTEFDSVEIEELKTHASQNIDRCLTRNNKRKLFSYRDLNVFLNDHDRAYAFSYSKGLMESDLNREECDVAMHSQSFMYCLDHDWGYDTIHIAGTFEKPSGGDFQNFLEYQWIGTLNNKGESMPGLFKRVQNKLSSLIRN